MPQEIHPAPRRTRRRAQFVTVHGLRRGVGYFGYFTPAQNFLHVRRTARTGDARVVVRERALLGMGWGETHGLHEYF